MYSWWGFNGDQPTQTDSISIEFRGMQREFISLRLRKRDEALENLRDQLDLTINKSRSEYEKELQPNQSIGGEMKYLFISSTYR